MHALKEKKDLLTQIKTRADFLTVQGGGKKWVSHGLILQTKPNDLGLKRIGFTVSKRVDKSAVKRNRIKRRLRAVAADILPAFAKGEQDYILVGKAATATRPFDALCNDLCWCLRKLDLEAQSDENAG